MQRIGIVGIGKISGIYLANLSGMFGKRIKLSGVTDLIPARSEKAAKEYNLKLFDSADDMVHSPDIDIILNLTQPQNHYEVAMAALNAGKHVYNEKPLSVKREEGSRLVKAAADKKVRIGGAPDTFLGPGAQTCRKLIDDGWIGKPVAANAFMLSHGVEDWHPDPEFYYKPGGGPMFDMGPYYLTALINLLGPVARISGSAQKGQAERLITSEPLNGTKITVDVPTHVAGVLDFCSGVVGVIITSFDIWSNSMPFIEIYGTEGTLQVPDPNYFRGEVRLRRFRDENWSSVPLILGEPDKVADRDNWHRLNNLRGAGITDMAEAIEQGRPHRACGEMTYHVLDVMQGIHDASASGRYYDVPSTCRRPEPMF
ncbi:MAG: Gfo/Idh/MocA family oxidoreductase [Treponema sp.]|nr:Gfo/Idh/MocA family oxidoreductase [Treponema sp.]